MKNILIYINDSLGELDWISPFIKSNEAKDFTFYIFLNGPGKTYKDKQNILQKYNLLGEDIFLLNENKKLDRSLFLIDNFLNKLLNKFKKYSYTLFKITRYIVDKIRYAEAYIYPKREDIQFEYIFRDYNLKDTTALNAYIVHNPQASIVIYPHAVGLQREHDECPREAPKQVLAHLWLENSELSDMVKSSEYYKNIFFASGVPAFDINYKKPSLFSPGSKRVLLITRDCNMILGFTYEEAFSVLEMLLKRLASMGYSVVIKHHPRDNRIQDWRNIQVKYSNVTELSSSLNDIDELYSACFTLFSTAPLYLLSRAVPVFEFSPYKAYSTYSEKMPMHYRDKLDQTTHDLLELELYKRVDDLNKLDEYMSSECLTALSAVQFKKCQEIFPAGANKNITNKLLELKNA